MAYENSTSRRPPVATLLNRLYEFSQNANIAADLEEQQLSDIASRVCEEYKIDKASRSDWEETAKKAMDAALQMRQPKSYPFPGASNVKWPLITVAALQFNARSYPEIVSPDGIVKTKVIGKDEGVPVIDPQTGQPAVDPETGQPAWEVPPGEKRGRAERISQHMTYQLTEEMEGWEEDTDMLLMQLPIVGDAVRKVYRGPDANVSELIPAMDFVVNQKTRSLSNCPRMTHVMKLYPFEIDERVADGRFLEIDLGISNSNGSGDRDAPHCFLEQHRRIDLDGDGYGEPYIVTVHEESQRIVRIVANYDAEDVTADQKRILRIKAKEYFVNYVFLPDPEGGFYGIGFGRLLESIGASIDTTINQMLDAGHLQNAGGGFIGAGVRFKKNVFRMEPGVYHSVPATGDNLRNAIVNFEHPGPSAVLFNLLGMMVEAARDITAVKDIFTGDSGGQTQTATTTLALIEQGLKVFTAIYKRIYRGLQKEFKLLFLLNAEHLGDEEYFNVLDTAKAIAKSDYDPKTYDVCPQADPRLVTEMQRLKRAEAIYATIEVNPAGAPEILRRYYTAIGAEDVDALLPQPQMGPMDELQIAGAEAEVENTQADSQLKQAKAVEAIEGVKIAKEELQLDSIKTVDESLRADDQMERSDANAAEDRKARDKKAAA